MKERARLLTKLLLTHVVLLTGLVLSSFLIRRGTLLILPLAQCFLLILLLAGYWEFFASSFRWVYLGINELLILLSFMIRMSSGHDGPPGIFGITAWAPLQLFLLFLLYRIIRVIYEKETGAIEIQFPFRQGDYRVTDGGNSRLSRLMNYHYHSVIHRRKNTHRSMLYATDVVKIHRRSWIFLPRRNEDYPVFGDSLYSPVSGSVVKVVNEIADNIPFSGDYPYNTGNTVILKQDDRYLLLGHLRMGSIRVREGDMVEAGEYLGEAGNSGMSERPHLHMQMMRSESGDYWKGEGVCIRYSGKNLYKNRLIRV